MENPAVLEQLLRNHGIGTPGDMPQMMGPRQYQHTVSGNFQIPEHEQQGVGFNEAPKPFPYGDKSAPAGATAPRMNFGQMPVPGTAQLMGPQSLGAANELADKANTIPLVESLLNEQANPDSLKLIGESVRPSGWNPVAQGPIGTPLSDDLEGLRRWGPSPGGSKAAGGKKRSKAVPPTAEYSVPVMTPYTHMQEAPAPTKPRMR